MVANAKPLLRWFCRASRRHPLDPQLKIAAAYGTDKYTIFVDGRDGAITEFIAMCRKGDTVGVTRFDRLANERQAWSSAVVGILGKGATIREHDSGETIGPNTKAAEIAVIAMHVADEITNELRSPTTREARRKQKLSAKAKRENLLEARLPIEQARKIWARDGRWTVDELLADMPGWSKDMAYRELKPRGLAKGRPRKSKR